MSQSEDRAKNSTFVAIVTALITTVTTNVDRIYAVAKDAFAKDVTGKNEVKDELFDKQGQWYGYYKDICSDGTKYMAIEDVILKVGGSDSKQTNIYGNSSGNICDGNLKADKKHKKWIEVGYQLSNTIALSYVEVSENLNPTGIGGYFLTKYGAGSSYKGVIVIKDTTQDIPNYICHYILSKVKLSEDEIERNYPSFLQPCISVNELKDVEKK